MDYLKSDKNQLDVQWNTWNLENRFSILKTKKVSEVDMFKTISST